MTEQVVTKRSEKRLPCQLSDDEIRLRGIDLAEANNEHGKVDAARKTAAKEYADQLKYINGRIRDLKDAVRNGVEVRPVEIEYRYNRYMGSVSIIRLDTGDTIETRAMTPAESQGRLDLDAQEEDERL